VIEADTTTTAPAAAEQRHARLASSSSPAALVATRIVRVLEPKTLLEVGGNDGLSDHLREAGVTARHVPIAVDAGGSGHLPDLPVGPWDVITCVGVFETLPPQLAEALLEQICAAATTVVISCGPATYFAPEAVSLRPSAAWAAALAERGFFRRIDLDIEFAGPWTVVFERSAPTLREVVYRYEQALAGAQTEISDRSSARGPRGSGIPSSERASSELEAEVADLKHRLLISRDYAIGQEAELARAIADTEAARECLDEVYRSTTWRIGSSVIKPLFSVRRTLGPRA
jgi:hypothetical protein